jgi:single-stranded-DNA-specific exonuclease
LESRAAHWELYKPVSADLVKRIQSELSHLELTALTVQVLANRGISEPGDIETFVNPPDISTFPDPTLLTGVEKAVQRIERAIRSGERIVVYGDFDADGVTATALLTLALRHFGAKVEPYVPNRIAEGYGLNANAVRELAAQGARLLITVDCGISGREEVAEATRTGMDVIVTDHHHLPDDLPEATACINPKQKVPGCECYEELAGVGVAYQLVRALVKRMGKPATLRNVDLLGLVAVGTVADMVPLTGANRSLVAQGLAALRLTAQSTHSLPGVRTLLEFAHVDIGNIDTERIGFAIGPRLNAAGRMDDARMAYRLLMTADQREARDLAQKLEAQNRRRQALMNSVVDQAKERARRLDDNVKLILLSDPEWPPGIVGLVAGRLAEEFGRPALVLAEGPEESRGSARGGPHFDIIDALGETKDVLVKYGGHTAAAGFTVKTSRIDELNDRLCRLAAERLDDHHLRPVHMADASISMADVTDRTLDSLGRLAPFGAGNPAPTFMAMDVRVLNVTPLGDGGHLKLMLADQTNINRAPVEAVAFRTGHMLDAIKRRGRVDLLFQIERRDWKGDIHLQLKVKDLRA